MLRDRYDPLDLFALVPKLGLAMDPILTQLDALLDDDFVFQKVRADLALTLPPDALSRSALDARRGDPQADRRQAALPLERALVHS